MFSSIICSYDFVATRIQNYLIIPSVPIKSVNKLIYIWPLST